MYKKFFIIFFYLLLSINIFANNIYTEGDLILKNDIFYEIKSEEPANGIKKIYNKNGSLFAESPYENGKVNGIVKLYFENGALMGETPYKNNKMNGLVKAYFENGALRMEVQYKDGERNGYEKYY